MNEQDEIQTLEQPAEVSAPAASEQPEAPKSLRDQIAAALDAQEKGETAAQKRARDEAGRFARTDKPATLPVTSDQAAPDAKPVDQAATLPVDQPAAQPQDKAPATWTPAAREQWAALPDAVRAEIVKREREAAQALTRQDEDRLLGKSIKDIATPYKAFIPQGMNEAQVVQSLLASHAKMAMASPAEKTQLLLGLARQYGADLSQFAAQGNQQQEAPAGGQAIPEVRQLFEEVGQLKSLLQSRDEQDQQANAQAVQAQVEAFAADPKNEFFGDVRDRMSQLIASGAAADLKDAYEQAIWSHGPTREVLINRANQQRIEQATAKAQAAKNAGSSVTGSPGKTMIVGARKPTDRRSLLAAAADELMPD